jgi:hypothetical protein
VLRKLLAIFVGSPSIPVSAVFSPNGKRILIAWRDGIVRHYLVQVAGLVKVTTCRVGRGLTEEEMARFQVPTPLKFDVNKRQCPPAIGR